MLWERPKGNRTSKPQQKRLDFLRPIFWSTVAKALEKTSIECACVLVTQSCLILCDPMDCSSPVFSVHGISQAGILEGKGSEVAQSCPTLWDPVDCSPPGSSIHGILQARILEWVDIPFSRGSSWHRDQTQVSCIAGRFFTIWVTRDALHRIIKRYNQKKFERWFSPNFS